MGAVAANTENNALMGAAATMIGSSIAGNAENSIQDYNDSYSTESYGSSSVAASGAVGDCWNQAQERILADVKGKQSSTPNICPNAKLSLEMYRRLRPAAQRCSVPQATINEIDRLIAESQEVVDASCI